jgi:hypothetical protein
VVRHWEIEAEQLQEEPISPSVWRSAKRNTARSVRAVVIARLE